MIKILSNYAVNNKALILCFDCMVRQVITVKQIEKGFQCECRLKSKHA